jgi:hypothetical protein
MCQTENSANMTGLLTEVNVSLQGNNSDTDSYKKLPPEIKIQSCT